MGLRPKNKSKRKCRSDSGDDENDGLDNFYAHLRMSLRYITTPIYGGLIVGFTGFANKPNHGLNQTVGGYMDTAKQSLKANSNLETMSVSELLELYDGTVEELRNCAVLNPSRARESTETDLRENILFEFESSLLEKATRIPLASKRDFLDIMDIWEKAAGIQLRQEVSLSNRIAMNIFRHMLHSKFGEA